MDAMKIANSIPMWLACALPVAFVILQAVLFASHLSKPFYSMMMKADQITMSGAWKNALACVLGAVIMFVLTKVANKRLKMEILLQFLELEE